MIKLIGVAWAALLVPTLAVGAELPPKLAGLWTKQADVTTRNPGQVVLAHNAATIDGERCTIDGVRALHAARWYADFTCGQPSHANRVWLDINLIAQDRIMLNRRPLAEADVYVRRAASEDGAK